MAKKQPANLVLLYEDAYTKDNGFDRQDPADEWYGLTCRIARVDDMWVVKVANSVSAPFMREAFEASGATVEEALAACLEKLIQLKGRPPLPKTRQEVEMEKFDARIQRDREDFEAKKRAVKQPPHPPAEAD